MMGKKSKYCVHCESTGKPRVRLARYEVFVAGVPIGLCKEHFEQYKEREELYEYIDRDDTQEPDYPAI